MSAFREQIDRITQSPGGQATTKWFQQAQAAGVERINAAANPLATQAKIAARRYTSLGQGIAGAYRSTIGAFGRVISSAGDAMMYETPTAFSLADLRRGRGARRHGLSAIPGRLTRGVGNTIQRPAGAALGTAKFMAKGPGVALKAAKFGRRGIKAIPKPIRKMGLVGGIALGVTAMLGASVLKGAMNQGRQIAYERYMEDAATSKNVLSSTRLGNASGTNRMLGYGGTVGLANSLSRTRHGRY